MSNFELRDLVDIVLVTLLFFGTSFLFRGAQAVALLRGTLFVLVGLILVSGVFQLQALQWLLQNSLFALAVAIPVIFQPELRRALERLGRTRIFSEEQATREATNQIIEEVCTTAERLSERRHGALIVLERESSLDEFIRTGVAMDSYVSAALLLTVFWPKTDLHDGAVIVNRAGRVAASAAVLPLSASRNMPQKKQGTRHRAALGITEVSDAICVVVSEETGRISVANGGRMIPRLDKKRLQTILNALYTPEQVKSDGLWHRLSSTTQRVAQQLYTRYGEQ
ncbi:MAG: diadenylate cyclase CdaA [Chloroflexota bacterium]